MVSSRDVLSPKQRSYCMSQIQGKNTKPEIKLRKALWSQGIRYRIKNKLPGKPDIVFPRFKLVVFVDGCFWHRCPKHYIKPKTRAKFWEEKISGNVERDKRNNRKLRKLGWSVVRIWEHDVKTSLNKCVEKIERQCFVKPCA